MDLNPTHRAAEAVISRLLQMRQLWNDAAASYFEPARFQLALQNCITVSRSVSFILQANKAAIIGFDDWYGSFQESWRSDPVMVWAKEARNTIEKKGDLETYSQIRMSIIASYIGGPQTEWLPHAIFASVDQIYRSIPAKYLTQHVRENGTLLIERRWIDSELRDIEVLEALAHVYGRLSDLIRSFLALVALPVPKAIVDTRPDSMGTLAMDRAIYVSMADGSLVGLRFFEKRVNLDPETQAKVSKHYRKISDWKSLGQVTSFRSLAEAFFMMARQVIVHDGYHQHLTFFTRGSTIVRMIQSDHPNRASRYVLMRDLAQLAVLDGADGVFILGEAWTAHSSDIPKSGFAAEAQNRGEALIMNAANAQGESFSFQAPIERKRFRRMKIKRLGPTIVDDTGFQFLLYPFMKEWNCVDEQALARALQQMDEMGIETP